MELKRLILVPLLVLALLLAACADTGQEGTPFGTDEGVFGTEPLGTEPLGTEPLGTEPLGTEPLSTEPLATEPLATEPAATEPVATEPAETEPAATEAATSQATSAATSAATGQATAAATGQATAGVTEGERTMVRSSELIGADIVDMNDETVAAVDEVLLNEAGEIEYVVFDASGYLAGTSAVGTPGAETTAPAGTPGAQTTAPAGVMTESLAAVPFTEFELNNETGADENQVLIFNGTADDLETVMMPIEFDLLDQDGFLIDSTLVQTDTPVATDFDGLIRVSRISDFNLMNANQESLGEVQDLILDLEQGVVPFAVVDFGGFLGIGSTSVAVPWERFTLNEPAGADAEANFTLDVTPETLENAPEINLNEWPSWPEPVDTDWETETRTYWETAS